MLEPMGSTVVPSHSALAARVGSLVSSASTMPLPWCVQSSGHSMIPSAASQLSMVSWVGVAGSPRADLEDGVSASFVRGKLGLP